MNRDADGSGGPRGISVTLAAALTAASYVLIRTGRSELLDSPAATLAHRPRHAAGDRVVSALTEVGSVYGIAGAATALAVAGRRRTAFDVAGSGLLAWTMAQMVKPFLDRERPYQLGACERLVSEPAGTSWPSGHAAVAAAMATIVADGASSPARRVLFAGVLGVGASRLYVGVHHLTDVLAGYGIGVVATRLWRLATTPEDARRRSVLRRR